MDADLATDISYTEEAVQNLKENSGIVIGSRTGEEAQRDLGRKIPSFIFNNLLKIVFNSGVDDHQCGFKFFEKEKIEEVMKDVENKGFFWDAELLVRAQRQGVEICEMEVSWQEEGDSKVDVVSDGLKFFKEIIRLKKDLITE